MDIFTDCTKLIEEELEKINRIIKSQSDVDNNEFQQTQIAIETVMSERDKSLDRILNQQNQLKLIIDKDSRIKALKDSIVAATNSIEELRRECNEINVKGLKARQELLDAESKEIEKFQMQQLRSIAEDQRRHKDLLEHRRREIVMAKKEIENEDKNRESYLADVEKNLNLQIQNRQEMNRGGTMPVGGVASLIDDLDALDNIELTTVDEYAPYGPTSTCRGDPKPASRAKRGRGSGSGVRGRGRGRGRGN